MRNRLLVAAVVLAAFAAFSRGADGRKAMQASAQAKPAEAHPDLTGVWNAMRNDYDFASFSKGDPPMTPWGKAQFDASKPSQGARGVTLEKTNDLVYKCIPPGMPYIYLQFFPMQILQTPTEVIELFESDHTVRHIFVDGRPHPADLSPTYNGHSIGHWEGDTLVVDTVGLLAKTWLDRLGHPKSEQMHIVEHIRRLDSKTLQVDLLFDDPKSYPKPWNAQIRFQLHPDWDILEDVCEDNKAFEGFEK
jgi:hypothetical protein